MNSEFPQFQTKHEEETQETRERQHVLDSSPVFFSCFHRRRFLRSISISSSSPINHPPHAFPNYPHSALSMAPLSPTSFPRSRQVNSPPFLLSLDLISAPVWIIRTCFTCKSNSLLRPSNSKQLISNNLQFGSQTISEPFS